MAIGFCAVGGGRTLIIEQEVILDVQRFVDKIVDGQVSVLQVVPSYLESSCPIWNASLARCPTCAAFPSPARH